MNCSYFALERRRTFKVNKKIKQKKQNKTNTKKQNKKTIKQAHKPKQNKTKIYKWANEEYLTQAQ